MLLLTSVTSSYVQRHLAGILRPLTGENLVDLNLVEQLLNYSVKADIRTNEDLNRV